MRRSKWFYVHHAHDILLPNMPAKTYSAQMNDHGNIIVCGDTIERNSYTIVFTGSY